MTRRIRMFLCGLALLAHSTYASDPDELVLYPAYGDVRGAVVEGRVVERHVGAAAQQADSIWANLRRSVRAFFNEEREGVVVDVRVAGRSRQATTDEEGYFTLPLAEPLPPGWHAVTAQAGTVEAQGALLVVHPQNTLGVISDLDDTILVSEVTSKRRLLKNTFLKNSLQRQAVPGAPSFYRSLVARSPQPDSAPLLYLSASPRQLQMPIQSFLDTNNFPRGVLLTKKVTNDDSSDPLTDQMAYKTAKIGEILTRLPHVQFILIGDDGERDPEIYHAIRERHPTRIDAVYIRRVHPDASRAVFAGQKDLADMLTIAE
jgi:phosphatidate phosphatase APP1